MASLFSGQRIGGASPPGKFGGKSSGRGGGGGGLTGQRNVDATEIPGALAVGEGGVCSPCRVATDWTGWGARPELEFSGTGFVSVGGPEIFSRRSSGVVNG